MLQAQAANVSARQLMHAPGVTRLLASLRPVINRPPNDATYDSVVKNHGKGVSCAA